MLNSAARVYHEDGFLTANIDSKVNASEYKYRKTPYLNRDRGATLRLGGTISDSILRGGGAQDTFSY